MNDHVHGTLGSIRLRTLYSKNIHGAAEAIEEQVQLNSFPYTLSFSLPSTGYDRRVPLGVSEPGSDCRGRTWSM